MKPPIPADDPDALSSGAADDLTDETQHLAYAEASYMLIECLMLMLIEHGLLSKENMVAAGIFLSPT